MSGSMMVTKLLLPVALFIVLSNKSVFFDFEASMIRFNKSSNA